MARNLIAPSKVWELIEGTNNPQTVERALLDALARKNVYAQADHTTKVYKAPKSAAPTKIKGKQISEAHWLSIAKNPALNKKVREIGQVTLNDHLQSVELHDISFDAEEVAIVVNKWGRFPTKKSVAATGRPTAEWWSDFTVEMVHVFTDTPGVNNQTANAILKAVLELMSKAGYASIPDQRSIQKTVVKALTRVRENSK